MAASILLTIKYIGMVFLQRIVIFFKEKIINITIEGNVEGDIKCDTIKSINIKGYCKNIEINNVK